MRKLDDLDVDPKELARAVSFVRILIGAYAFVAPRRLARSWTGHEGDMIVAPMALRGMGVRDIALGLGTLLALDRGKGASGWLEACALSDAGDVISTLAKFGELPLLKRFGALATAGTGAYLGMALAEAIDE